MLGRVVSLPLDLLSALRQVPGIARDTNRMAEHTEVLEEVAETTRALPELRREMQRVAEATALIATMDARMATIADAMPVLVEVQRHLARSQPDAVLIDLQRSEAEGLQLLTRMRARQTLCNVPILFLAGSDADDFRHQAVPSMR